MIDAMWDYFQHHYPKNSKKWLADRKWRIVGYNLPRFWYVDNTNLERCGLKIKYENIFPKEVSIPRHSNYHKGGGHNNRLPYNNYDNDQDIDFGDQDMTYPQHEDDFDDNATENDTTDNESNDQNSNGRSNDDESESNSFDNDDVNFRGF